MTTPVSTIRGPEIEYPDSDGQPMAENTLQFRWIVTVEGNLEHRFWDDPNVFVAGDLLWYAVEGHPEIRLAPDALVAFGRPKGRRGSYRQWVEGGIAPQVVWEILSPGNRAGEMAHKFNFYERYGVEEYYVYDPDDNEVFGWRRIGGRLQPIPQMHDWVSPLLGIRFDTSGDELVLYHPNGERFRTFGEIMRLREETEQQRQQAEQQRQQAEQQCQQAEQQRQQAEQQRQQAEQQRQQAEQQRQQAEQRTAEERQAKLHAEQRAEQERLARTQAEQTADQLRQAREAAHQRAEQLAARLRALGIDPDQEP